MGPSNFEIEKKVPDKKESGTITKFVTAAKLSNFSDHNPAIKPSEASSDDPRIAKTNI